MRSRQDIKDALSGYCLSVRQLILHPTEFFAVKREPTYGEELLASAPAIALFILGLLLTGENLWLAPIYVLAAYAGIAAWATALKYIIIVFGEKRRFGETLQIASGSSLALAIAWIPQYGLPLAYLLVGFWSYKGLIGAFKMHSGAALAATFLPVVILGLCGNVFGFVFLWLASLTTIFSR